MADRFLLVTGVDDAILLCDTDDAVDCNDCLCLYLENQSQLADLSIIFVFSALRVAKVQLFLCFNQFDYRPACWYFAAENLIDKKFDEIQKKIENGEEASGFLAHLLSTNMSKGEVYGNIAEIMLAAVDTVSIFCT